MTTYAELMPYLVPELPGAHTPQILRAIREGVREFCLVTGAWWKDLDAIDIVADQQEYDLAASLPSDSDIAALRWVKVDDAIQDPTHFILSESATLRWRDNYIPARAITDGLKVSVTLLPALADDALAEWVLTRWYRGIVSFILVDMLSDPHRLYGRTGRLPYWQAEKDKWEHRAKFAAVHNHVNQDFRAGGTDWLI